MRHRILLAPLILLTCAGSQTQLGQKKYILPPDQTATATVKFLEGNLRLSMMRGDTQYYGIMPDATCKTARKLITYSGGIGGNTEEKVIPIEAGKPVRIVGSIMKQADGGYMTELFSTCTNLTEFTPQAGSDYIITQIPNAGKPVAVCELKIVEQQSGLAPPDAQVLPAPPCGIW